MSLVILSRLNNKNVITTDSIGLTDNIISRDEVKAYKVDENVLVGTTGDVTINKMFINLLRKSEFPINLSLEFLVDFGAKFSKLLNSKCIALGDSQIIICQKEKAYQLTFQEIEAMRTSIYEIKDKYFATGWGNEEAMTLLEYGYNTPREIISMMAKKYSTVDDTNIKTIEDTYISRKDIEIGREMGIIK